MFPFWSHTNGDYMDMAATYASDAVPQHGTGNVAPIRDVQFTSTTMCPRNFIVFDQTNRERQIMFHPSLVSKVDTSYLQPSPTNYGENLRMKGMVSEQREQSSSYEEDSADIDALLGSEIEGDGVGEENYDDDEVSTARTNGNYEFYSPDTAGTNGNYEFYSPDTAGTNGNYEFYSPDSCFIGHASEPVKLDDSCSSNETKEQKIQEMVKVLRGIVPGGNRMSTATLLDEAVRYLKAMKIEAANLGHFTK